jgi:hypothetical protein
MQWRRAVRPLGASRRSLSRPIGLLAVAALAASAAGCSSSPSIGSLSLASATSSRGATVAFESIDGPPPEVFRKLVASLNDEAGARRISMVSRGGAATYRIRGYVSAQVARDKTTFAWVWDVYDTDKRRALRISGEEPAAAGRRKDAWAAADEQVVRRMARNGMDQIAGFLNSPGPEPALAPEPTLATLVSGRDDTPEGAGIFRVFGAPDQAAGGPAAKPEPETTAPPPSPRAAKTRSAAAPAKQAASATDGRSPGR